VLPLLIRRIHHNLLHHRQSPIIRSKLSTHPHQPPPPQSRRDLTTNSIRRKGVAVDRDERGSAQNGFHRLLCEANSLLCVARHTSLIQRPDLHGREISLQVLDDIRIPRAAAAHEDLIDLLPVLEEGLILPDYVLRGYPRDGRHGIVFGQSLFQALRHQHLTLVVAESFPPGCFGRAVVDVPVVFEESVHDRLVHGASCAPFPVPIVLHLSVREVPHRVVDEHVSRATIPVHHPINAPFRVWRYDAEIRNTPDVLTDAPFGRMV